MNEKQALGDAVHRKNLQKCARCHKGVMHTGLPLFWRVSIERMGIDVRAVERTHGMDLQIGPALSAIMGPDDALAKPIGPVDQVFVCESCALEPLLIAALTSEDES